MAMWFMLLRLGRVNLVKVLRAKHGSYKFQN